MKPCDYCGYKFEHSPDTCRILLGEKKSGKKLHHFKRKDHPNRVGNVGISRKNILDLAEYLNGKRQY